MPAAIQSLVPPRSGNDWYGHKQAIKDAYDNPHLQAAITAASFLIPGGAFARAGMFVARAFRNVFSPVGRLIGRGIGAALNGIGAAARAIGNGAGGRWNPLN